MFSKIGEKVRKTDEEQGILIAFCYASLRVGIDKGFDIDHSYPFSRIRQNQEALLACLNKQGNEEFAKAFMATQGIEKFFKRAGDGKIKGTMAFFECCYNELGNLIPITHYINREKSDDSPQEWVERTFTGKLLEEFRTKNPICDGVILGRIFDGNDTGVSTTFEMAELIEISDDNSEESKGKISGHTHPKNVQGLGEFIIDWFITNKEQIIERAKDIYTLEGRLNCMLKENMENNDENGAVNKTLKTLNRALKTIDKFRVNLIIGDSKDEQLSQGQRSTSKSRSEGEETTADSEAAEVARDFSEEYNLLRSLIYMHRAKQIKQEVLTLVNQESIDLIKKDFYNWGFAAGLHKFDGKIIDQAFDVIRKSLHDPKNRQPFTAEEVKKMVFKAEDTVNPEKKYERMEVLKQIADIKENISDLVLRSYKFLEQTRKSGQYKEETLTKCVDSLKNVEEELSKLKSKTKDIPQETDLQRLQEFLAEAEKQKEKAEEMYSKISATPPSSASNPLPRKSSTLLDEASRQSKNQKSDRNDAENDESASSSPTEERPRTKGRRLE